MSGTSRMTAIPANLGPEHLFGNGLGGVRLIAAVMKKLREIYPEKTAANIAARTGVSTRAAEYWMANTRTMSAEVFLSLLTSEHGGELLEAVMSALPEKRRPAWWRKHATSVRMWALEKSMAEHDAEMRQLRLEMVGPRQDR